MTIEEIQKKVHEIEESAFDAEAAHGLEDDLREAFIVYVTTLDIPSLADSAKLVLSTNDIDFPRWCA